MGRDDRDTGSGPTLLAQAIITEIRGLKIVRHLVGGRVAYKRNSKGEHVVAIVFPPQPP